MNKKEKIFFEIFSWIVSFTVLLIGWEVIVRVGDISPLVLVKPSEIFPVLIEEWPIFFKQIRFTFVEVVAGWTIGNFLGVVLAIFIYDFIPFTNFFMNIGVFINAIPIIALSSIIGGFIGTGPNAKIFIVSLMCFFPMFISALTGFTRINENEQKLMDSYATGKIKRFINLIFPSGLPIIADTLKINVVTAIFAAVVSEFFGAHGGVGPLILENKGLYNLPMIWGALFYVVLVGSVFYLLTEMINKIVVYWRK